jgi:hypothetical protein
MTHSRHAAVFIASPPLKLDVRRSIQIGAIGGNGDFVAALSRGRTRPRHNCLLVSSVE